MDRLQSMRVFARVAERGSLAAVAREMDLSPAVVTRLIADLEAHLNVRLLNRTTRRVSLTDVGAGYLERVRAILAEIDEAEALAAAATHEPSGPLRLCMPPAFASHQLAHHLPAFVARYPKITIDLDVQVAREVPDETADLSLLILGRDRPPQGDFIARLLATTSVVISAAPAYLERRGRPKDPRELGVHETLIPALPHVPREWCLVDPGTGRQMTVAAQSTLATAHVDTLLAAACAGLGLVALPSFVVSDALREGRLEPVVTDWKIGDYHVYAAWRSRKYLPARTRAMLDFLVETFGGEDRDPWLPSS